MCEFYGGMLQHYNSRNYTISAGVQRLLQAKQVPQDYIIMTQKQNCRRCNFFKYCLPSTNVLLNRAAHMSLTTNPHANYARSSAETNANTVSWLQFCHAAGSGGSVAETPPKQTLSGRRSGQLTRSRNALPFKYLQRETTGLFRNFSIIVGNTAQILLASCTFHIYTDQMKPDCSVRRIQHHRSASKDQLYSFRPKSSTSPTLQTAIT